QIWQLLGANLAEDGYSDSQSSLMGGDARSILGNTHVKGVSSPDGLTAPFWRYRLYSLVTNLINDISSEVWQVLGAVKTEFGKFGEVLDKVSEKLDQAQKQIEQTGVRSRAIQRQLRGVEAMPTAGVDAESLPE
ncbi:MAG: DNA recombination protein RmuC, partial [Pseudomonadota bacterium]